jgi:hypothetical protein
MRAITYERKMQALELYLEGLSTNQVVERTGISKGAVVGILADARAGRFPVPSLGERLEEAHVLGVKLKKEGISLTEARLGIRFLKRLQVLGVEPERLAEWEEFSSRVGPEPPEGFLPAAMEFFKLAQEKGKSYSQLLAEVRELSAQRDRLAAEVADLQIKEERARQLRGEIEGAESEAAALKARRDELKSELACLEGLLERRAAALGVPSEELEPRLKELIAIEEEVATRRKERDRLRGEVEALAQRETETSARMAKGVAELENDLGLLKTTRRELVETGELKGRLEKELEQMEWAVRVMPFLSDPDRVADGDFSLIAIVVACLDRWLPTQLQFWYRSDPRWSDVKGYVHSKRMELRKAHGGDG